MAKSKPYRLGELQLAILKVLWECGPAAVDDVRKGLDRRKRPAYTTVATVLRRMEDDGLVTHDEDGRRFIYRPAVAPERVAGSMAGDLLDRVFEGSLSDMVSHLLRGREVDPDELDRIERLIARKRDQA